MAGALMLGIGVSLVYHFYLTPKPVAPADQRAASLTAPQTVSAPVSFTGRYELEDKYLEINQLSPEKVSLKGYAEWYNSSGTIHVGEIEGEASLSGNQATFERSSDGCTVSIEFLADKIRVTDNKKCGGMNVTFDGNYPKVK